MKSLISQEIFDITKNIAFNEIFKLINKKDKLNIDDLGYLIGPILNSGGRLGKSQFASELLSSDNLNIVNIKLQNLGTSNRLLVVYLNIANKQITKWRYIKILLPRSRETHGIEYEYNTTWPLGE